MRLPARAIEALNIHHKRQLKEKMRHAGLWEDQDLVFTTTNGTLINPSNLTRRSFRFLLQKAGLPRVRFHDLRHTCATLLLLQGVHIKFVQELLGYASVTITLDTYSHVLPSMCDAASGAMDAALG